MSRDVRELADAVLHEGYLLYPYRSSALKNVHRYPFGTLYPEAFCRAHEAGDPSAAACECIAVASPVARVSIEARFLQLAESGAVLREVRIAPSPLSTLSAGGRRASFELGPLRGELALTASEIDPGRWKLSMSLHNATSLADAEETSRDQALLHALASAHLLIHCEDGELVSAIDPPDELRELVESCRSVGLWPVLVGDPGARSTILAAPIILYDYPQIASESPGDFFDATEIDELLTLRVLTLTDDEKRAMSEEDPRARAILERTEASGLARLAELHGRTRGGVVLRPGVRVRLRPEGRADIFDLALAGKEATIESVERDFEGRTHVAVTVDDDPGKDLGAHGHRFFFRPEEIELL